MIARFLYLFRYISVIAVICSFFGAILMFCIGAYRTYQAIAVFLNVLEVPNGLKSVTMTDLAMGSIIKSIDAFLIGLAVIIFGYGVFNLFIRPIETGEASAFKWIQVPSIGHLKSLLAEIVIVILFVKFLEIVVVSINNLSWEMLILPSSILLLALGLKFIALRHD